MDIYSTLYHYCNTETFLNIIKGKTLRLCNIFESNDYMERQWTDKLVESELNNLDNRYKKFASSVRDIYYRNKNNHPPYVISFCEEPDLLSQWRGYAEDGTGFAIGININSFAVDRKLFYGSPAPSTNDNATLGYCHVIYDEAVQLRNVKHGIESFLIEDPLDPQFIIKTLSAASYLIKLSTISKSPAFNEEKEWRIMYTPMMGDTGIIGALQNIQFCSKKNIVTSFFDLVFPQNSPINEIIIGPKNTSTFETIKSLLKCSDYNLSDIKLSRSVLSYR